MRGLEKFNENPDRFDYYELDEDDKTIHWLEVFEENGDATADLQAVRCPYGKAGDVLWVRETLYQDGELGLQYVSDGDWIDESDIPENYKPKIDKKGHYKSCQIPNIFMPFWACRIFLRISDIRIERLKDITDQDAIAEGIQFYHQEVGMPRYRDYMADASGYGDPIHDYPTVGVPACSFSTLWESINGDGSWYKNPWVWVVSFERCEKPIVG